MDVLAALEAAEQSRIVRERGDDAELDLAVVRVQQQPSVFRNESAADGAAFGRAHGNVLEVGIVGGEATRGHGGGVELGVHAARDRIDHQRQRLHIGAQQLLHLPVLKQRDGDLRAVVLRQFLKHILIGARRLRLAGALEDGQAQLLVEDLAELGGTVEVEAFARQLRRPRNRRVALGAHLHAQLVQHGGVQAHAVQFHLSEHFHQRQVNFGIEALKLLVRHLGLDGVAETERKVRVLGGVLHGLVEVGLVEALHGLALANHLLEGDGLGVEPANTQVIQVVAEAGVEHIAQHHAVITESVHRQAVTREHFEVVFEVLADLLDGGIGEEGREDRLDFREGQVARIEVRRELRPKVRRVASQIEQRFRQAGIGQQTRQRAIGILRGGLEMGQWDIKAFVRFPRQR